MWDIPVSSVGFQIAILAIEPDNLAFLKMKLDAGFYLLLAR